MRKIIDSLIRLFKVERLVDDMKVNQGKALVSLYTPLFSDISKRLWDYEFKIFSQWGEDGIIQFLISNIEIESKLFIEFGVENYRESNTRFLLINNNWSGLVFDGTRRNIDYIRSDSIYWKYNLKADCAFINRENINNLISRNGLSGEIGLLSVDIDGNDYWVWEAINVINPCIVVCEYNSLWGCKNAVTTPYDPNFVREKKHFSNLYYGASIKALNQLANSKGYSLVGGNSAGNNAFFVRNDLLDDIIKSVSVEDAWVQSQFRESRDEKGNLTFLSFDERRELLAEMPLIDIETNLQIKVRELR